jgi:hypothetical protein
MEKNQIKKVIVFGSPKLSPLHIVYSWNHKLEIKFEILDVCHIWSHHIFETLKATTNLSKLTRQEFWWCVLSGEAAYTSFRIFLFYPTGVRTHNLTHLIRAH